MSVVPLAAAAPVRDRCVPVDEAFASMLPDAGLVRGRVVGCTGPSAISLALALAARAVQAGSWLAAVGVPMLGVEAAGELGVPLSRVVAVDATGGPAAWAERVGAAADGFDLIITRPPSGAERAERKIRQRLQARGVILFAVGPSTVGVGCDVEFTTTRVDWAGIGQGFGSLQARRAMVRIGGRRVPRPVERELWLPARGGGIDVVEPVPSTPVVATTASDVDVDADAGAGTDGPGDEHVEFELERAG